MIAVRFTTGIKQLNSDHSRVTSELTTGAFFLFTLLMLQLATLPL